MGFKTCQMANGFTDLAVFFDMRFAELIVSRKTLHLELAPGNRGDNLARQTIQGQIAKLGLVTKWKSPIDELT